jgi:hypothetical protein
MHQPFAVRKVLMPQHRPQLYWTEAIHYSCSEQQYPLSPRFPPRLKTSQPLPCQLWRYGHANHLHVKLDSPGDCIQIEMCLHTVC